MVVLKGLPVGVHAIVAIAYGVPCHAACAEFLFEGLVDAVCVGMLFLAHASHDAIAMPVPEGWGAVARVDFQFL